MTNPVIRSRESGTTKWVRAEGGLNYLRGNSKPYFSLTMASYDVHGAAHEELLKIWPELKPLADLHLSTIDGVPMLALENGLYYVQHMIPGCSGYGPTATSFADNRYGKKLTDDECTLIMAKHFRISLNEARGLLVMLINAAENGISQYERIYGAGSKPVVKAALAAWVEAQKPRWKAEADACIKALDLKVFGDTWNPVKEAA